MTDTARELSEEEGRIVFHARLWATNSDTSTLAWVRQDFRILIAIIDRLRACAADALPAEGWRPIESAPKDRPILVCDRYIQVCQVVHWNAHAHHQDFNWKTEEGTTYHKDAFTDWMPLPATPTPVHRSANPDGK